MISLLRRGRQAGEPVVVVLNWTPLVRQSYRVGVPEPGYYRELLNSDASTYGGSNVGNEGGRASEPVPAHGHQHSLVLTIPPLGVLFLKRDVAAESVSSLVSP